MRVEVREVVGYEVDAMLEMWIEKSRRLEERGKGLWKPEQFTRERLQDAYDEPVYYGCFAEGSPIGGFILIEHDERYWPEERGSDALYIHKLFVKDEFAGMGIADAMLDWIAELGAKRRKTFLRLDFDPDREYLVKLYARNGFAVIEIMNDIPGRRMAKAERRLARGPEREVGRESERSA